MGYTMSYYDAVKVLQANGWVSIKFYKNREIWTKNDKTVQIVVLDRISKKLINSIIAMG